MALFASCCPCAFCKFAPTIMPKINLSTLANHPDLLNGILALRQRIAGTFN
jgi:hypothetical protein